MADSPKKSRPSRKFCSLRLVSSHYTLVILLLIVGAVVFCVHRSALDAEALCFDDEQYLLENQLVQNPSWSSAKRFLVEVSKPSTVGGYYQPLSMISLMLDCALGAKPDNLKPFRITSLSLHVINTSLVIVLLYMLFGEVWPAVMVGLLFGVHPLTVEPIPWLGERKTLLASFFALWCMIIYVRYTHRSNWKLYVGCVVTYVLALMAKPTTTPLPALLLLLDFWPLKRLTKQALLEKVPLLIIMVIFASITVISQSRSAAIVLPTEFSPLRIPLTLCHNIVFYLYKIVWPVRLSSHYPFPVPLDFSNSMVLAGVIGTCVLIPALLISLRWTCGLAVGWLFFFVAIFPTMGVIAFTNVIASDKFAYLPSVGLLMILTSLLVWLWRRIGRLPVFRIIIVVFILALCVLESVATGRYLRKWRDTETLYSHMLALAPDVADLHNNFGDALQREGKIEQAIKQYLITLRLDPAHFKAHSNLGVMLYQQCKIDEAISQFRRAILLSPNYDESLKARENLGIAMAFREKLDNIIMEYHRQLRLKPDNVEAMSNLGFALAQRGRFDAAVGYYSRAIELEPNDAITHARLAAALVSQEKIDEAIEQFQIALSIQPLDVEMRCYVGTLLERQGKIAEAIKQYRMALQINPDYTNAHSLLQAALAKQGPQ